MLKTQNYSCEKCGNQVSVSGEETSVPECCDQDMVKVDLPVCEVSSTAEHSRMDESIEPCDDGRAGDG